MPTFKTKSTYETEKLAENISHILKKGDTIAFFGGMGMGKTAFVRGLARGLSVRDEVLSPTFAIVNEYRGDIPIYHFDMYRVTSFDDLYTTGFFDYLDAESGVIACEWSENIENALPENTIKITFERISDDERVITIKGDERFENFSG